MSKHPGQHPSDAPRRILIVDDEAKICHFLAEHFRFNGYEVREVQQGEEALAISQVFQPHVVLLDLLMPGMNGIETLNELKRLPHPPKVLMVSAADHEDVVKGALELGVDFYVCKPVNLSELDHLVDGFSPSKH